MNRFGLSGQIAQRFQDNPITPLIALIMIVLGVIALLITPKEEDPQIDVTMVDIFLAAPGLGSTEIANQIASPAERWLSQIAGVKHVYSTALQGQAILTVQYQVGIQRQEALVKTWNQVMTEFHWPEQYDIRTPRVRARGINDVPILALTLWSQDTAVTQTQLGQVGTTLAELLQRVPGTRAIDVLGAAPEAIKVTLHPARLTAYGLTPQQIVQSLHAYGGETQPITVVQHNQSLLLSVGQALQNADQIADLIIGGSGNQLITLRDVATIARAAQTPTGYVQMSVDHAPPRPAVTLSIAKKAGENAIDVANRVLAQVETLQGQVIPHNIIINTTRNSGQTAQDKASQLMQKLLLATLAVVVLVYLTLGWRAALVVGGAVALTLLITLFASWAWGFTLNRISLFALIFSIGILVDDAIVVVENIHRRHLATPDQPLIRVIPAAVDEVGVATILATLTVIAALIPMAFVSGLMGPYMSPIPVNASTGMILSLLIAFTITPWLAIRLLRNHQPQAEQQDRIGAWVGHLLTPFISGRHRTTSQWLLFLGLCIALIGAMLLPVTQQVLLKMLPFDNKPTLTVVVNLPEDRTAEQTLATLQQIALTLRDEPTVTDYQLYAGTPAPITFNGLVRQYYLRQQPHQGEITINLLPKAERNEGSHTIAKRIRQRIQPLAQAHHADIAVVEEPSGPPTLAPLVAQIYGPTAADRAQTAQQLQDILRTIPDVVDIDSTLTADRPHTHIRIQTRRAAEVSITPHQIRQALSELISEQPTTYLHDQRNSTPTPIVLRLAPADKANLAQLRNITLRNRAGQQIPLHDLISLEAGVADVPVQHKNLRPVTYVTADMAGELDSPLYAMFSASAKLTEQHPHITQYYATPPEQPYQTAIKWDGEWQITLDTFRDMGLAYSAGLLLIYLLVVGTCKDYRTPLIIMAPIPLTLLGVMPGHWLLNAKFTATSMIGIIALAGIIVRNSILLVDFIRQQLAAGCALEQAVIDSVRMRSRPILLTAVAAMIGSLFILPDPIFRGLAIALIFGLAVSSLLTLFVIPIGYYRMLRKQAVTLTP
ncbi:MAG: efflux RND transporter permease subunit [Pseudomonadota bacterium]